ncbi:MAG: hypothetical protein ABR568_23670, partial [Pyrinomonadaceae bacterium]
MHFLANQDEHCYFALLGDFPDCETEETPDDTLLLTTAAARIDELNLRYGNLESPCFYIFH